MRQVVGLVETLPRVAMVAAVLLATQPGRAEEPAGPKPKHFRAIDPDPISGFPAAVIADDVPLVYTAQAIPVDGSGRVLGEGDAARQTQAVLSSLVGTLRQAGSGLNQVAKLNIYVARAGLVEAIQPALAKRLSETGAPFPAVTFVESTLPGEGMLVSMDAVAGIATETKQESRVELWGTDARTGTAKAAVLPAGPKLYISGMADTNELVLATRATMTKLFGALAQLGSAKEDIVQLKAFVQPISRAEMVRDEIAKLYEGRAPPLVLVEWISPAPNPPIEIELIARARGDLSRATNAISFLTPAGTTSTRVFSRVARVNYGKQIYVSGLYGRSNERQNEVREIFEELGKVLNRAGSDFDHLVKATYYVIDEEASNRLNAIRPEFYPVGRAPAASKATVRGVANQGKGALLDMIAVAR